MFLEVPTTLLPASEKLSSACFVDVTRFSKPIAPRQSSADIGGVRARLSVFEFVFSRF